MLGKEEKQFFTFDIEEKLQNDAEYYKQIREQVQQAIQDIRSKLSDPSMGVSSQQELEQYQKLRDGYASFQKVMDKVMRKPANKITIQKQS